LLQDYPPLYVLRPDGSTLYTYRDVVYSFKKAASADLVLNIICSEQDLAQQKVALAMAMLNPAMTGRQYHVSYDLVRLPSGRMSGRRGRYLLADDLYDELKARQSIALLYCPVPCCRHLHAQYRGRCPEEKEMTDVFVALFSRASGSHPHHDAREVCGEG
jgi:hypothetical protein